MRCSRKVVQYAAAFVVSFLAIGGAQSANAQDFGPLSGTWEGELVRVDAPGLSNLGTQSYVYRLIIKSDVARVFVIEKGKPAEYFRPWSFRVHMHKTNAVISNIHSSSDGAWVETWAFAVTQKDRETLLVRHVRLVNNVHMPLSEADSKFTFVRIGEMRRQ
jgi:hypothetical protein